MKAQLATAMFIGLLACSLGRAQTPAAGETPASTNAPVAATPANDAPAAAAPASEATVVAPASEAPAVAPANDAPVAAAASEAAVIAPTEASTGVPSSASAVIPLIQFQDVALTTAIENLARQAELNYILDPKVSFGQPGPDGKPVPQPNINLRWEKLTAEQALMALLTTYNLQLVDDPKTRVSRITTKDPAAPDPLVTKVIQLQYAGPSNILSSVQSALTDKRSKVVPDIRTSQLVVVATEKELAGVEELLKQLDTPTKQVLIEAKILETSVNPRSVKGIDWSGTLRNQKVTFGNGNTIGDTKSVNSSATTSPGTPVTSTTTLPGGRVITSTTTPRSSTESIDSTVKSLTTIINPLVGGGGVSYNTLGGFSPHTAFLNADGVYATMSFLNESADTKVVSEPRLVTLDNQRATIDVGLMYPIVNVQAGTANTAGGSSISYSNLTVNLDVTPRITANDFIEMRVLQSILRLGRPFVSTVGGVQNVVDSFFTRNLETAVLIPSGNTLVMGGLISDESSSGNTKVPILGDLPVMGLLFRKDSKERNRQNLLIFITPTIVKDADFQPTQSKFLQSTGKEAVSEDVSAWDSGKPRDWSKPKGAPIVADFGDSPATPEASSKP